jgi:predicted ATPase
MDYVELEGARVDLRRRVHVRGEQQISLTKKEAELLGYLASRPGRVVSWEELHREVWHHPPSMVSRAAYFTWRRLVTKLEPRPEQPSHLLGHHGDGVSFVPCPGSELPAQVGLEDKGFFGREAEREQFFRLWQGGARWVSVVGPAGSGKTRFVREVAQGLLGQGEVWWCEVAGCAGVDEIVEKLCRMLGLREVGACLAALETRRAIVILDDLDKLVGPVGVLCRSWLSQTRALRWLTTSRERTLQPDELPLEMGPLEEDAAVALFVDRVKRAEPRWDPSPWTSDLQRLVLRLDRLPLALELAAGRSVLLSPRELERLLVDRFELLRRRGDSSRHGSLWAALETSWERMDRAEQRAFAQLSVFRGGFSFQAAQAVVQGAAADVLEALRAASMIHVLPGSAPLRFGLYETLHAFAERQLEPEERAQAELRHARWYAAHVDGWLEKSRKGEPAPELEPERENLRAVWERVPDTDEGAACLCALSWLGRARTASGWLLHELDRAIARDRSSRGLQLQLQRVIVQMQAGRHAEAWAGARSLAGQPRGSQAHLLLAEVAYGRGEPQAMLAALDRLGKGPDWLAQAYAGGLRALALLDLGRLFEARHVALSQLADFEGRHSRRGRAVLRCDLASIELALGRTSSALQLLELAHEEFGQEHLSDQATAKSLLSIAWMEGGDFRHAESLLHEALEQHTRAGSRAGVVQALTNLGVARRELGGPGLRGAEEALELHRQALAMSRELGNLRSVLFGLLNLAADALTLGDMALADEALAEIGETELVRVTVRARCLRALRDEATGPLDGLGELEGELGALVRAVQAQTRPGDLRFSSVRWARELRGRWAGSDLAHRAPPRTAGGGW